MSSRSHFSSPSVNAFFVSLVLPLFIGCSSEPTTPFEPALGGEFSDVSGRSPAATARDASAGFYPLAVGNRWHLSRVFTLDYHGLGADTIRTSTDRVNIGTETWPSRGYFVQEETSTQDSRPGEVFRSWTRYRQDRAGLYYRDICACEPPTLDQGRVRLASTIAAGIEHTAGTMRTRLSRTIAPEDGEAFNRSLTELNARMERMRRALSLSTGSRGQTSGRPGGADSEEVTLLPYPLHAGKTWQIRPDFDLFWTVEGVEMLETPAGKFSAYRIRVTVPGEGPEDFARIWFGRAGQLAYRIHVVVTEGYPGSGWTGDETEMVDWLSISR